MSDGVTATPAADEYLTLRQLAGYSKLSERQLRKLLALPRVSPSPATVLPGPRLGR